MLLGLAKFTRTDQGADLGGRGEVHQNRPGGQRHNQVRNKDQEALPSRPPFTAETVNNELCGIFENFDAKKYLKRNWKPIFRLKFQCSFANSFGLFQSLVAEYLMCTKRSWGKMFQTTTFRDKGSSEMSAEQQHPTLGRTVLWWPPFLSL